MGIDQSMSCTGIVIFDDNKMIHHDVVKTSKDEHSIFERFNIITNILIDLIFEYNVIEISIEGLAFGPARGNATRDLAGLQAVIVSNILEKCGITCKIAAPTAVKKFATGNGKASKTEMAESLPENILESFKKSGFKKSTGLQDLTDAYYIGLYS